MKRIHSVKKVYLMKRIYLVKKVHLVEEVYLIYKRKDPFINFFFYDYNYNSIKYNYLIDYFLL